MFMFRKVFCAIVIVAMLAVMPAEAASLSVTTRANAQEQTFADAALVNGWYFTMNKEVKNTASKIYRKYVVRNRNRYRMVVTQTTKKSGGSLKTIWKTKSQTGKMTKFSLSAITAVMAKYKVAEDVPARLQERAEDLASTLVDVAESYGWTISNLASGCTNGVATVTFKVSNAKYGFTIGVQTKISGSSVAVNYLRDGKASNADSIAAWLKSYGSATTVPADEDEDDDAIDILMD